MSAYTITNGTESVEVTARFVNSCEFYSNMFEDLGVDDPETPLLLSDIFDFSVFKEELEFFNEFDELEVTSDKEEKMSILDYMYYNKGEFQKRYAHKKTPIPHEKKILKIYNSYGQDKLKGFLQINKYLNNKRIALGIMLCIMVYIFNNPNDSEMIQALMETYEKRI